MAKTKIEWCDYTFNPWWGCAKVAPECTNCYAEAWAKRVGQAVWGVNAPRRFFGEQHWTEPMRWNRRAARDGVRRRVFCASMCDVFERHPDLHDELFDHRAKLWPLIEETEQLDWLILTKRPYAVDVMVPTHWLRRWPRNAWLGVTAGHPDSLWRVEVLLGIQAEIPVRFLSAEPLLAGLDLSPWLYRRDEDGRDVTELPRLWHETDSLRLDWVIAGAESGPRARAMDEDWVRSLRDQCQAAGVPFFFKQRLENGRKVATPELDGRTWVEYTAPT
jgi:protein gp37